jgi:hypothetical protein
MAASMSNGDAVMASEAFSCFEHAVTNIIAGSASRISGRPQDEGRALGVSFSSPFASFHSASISASEA